MESRIWTVVRFPAASWGGGGSPNDPDYSLCEVYLVPAEGLKKAMKKAQGIRARLIKKGSEPPSQASPYRAKAARDAG